MLGKALFMFHQQGWVQSWQRLPPGSPEYGNAGEELALLEVNCGQPASQRGNLGKDVASVSPSVDSGHC